MFNQKEESVHGILPKNTTANTVFNSLEIIGLASVIVSFCMLLSTLFLSASVVASQYFRLIANVLAYLALGSFVLMLVIRVFFLKTPKLDEWLLDFAKDKLGTDVIFYTKDELYIQYDKSNKDCDFNAFVKELSDKSELYNYTLIKVYAETSVVEIKYTSKLEK